MATVQVQFGGKGGTTYNLETNADLVAVRAADHHGRSALMCRNIKTLYNFEPPATEEEIRASALQYVRKVSGFTRPSRVNEAAFDYAVDEVARITRDLVDSLETRAAPRDREVEAARSRARGLERRALMERAARG